MKMNLRKNAPWLIIALLSTGIIPGVLATKPIQTKQGCQTEGADYLVDVIWVEFGPGIYTLLPEELAELFENMGLDTSDPFVQQFMGLIDGGGTIVGYFGPCCFKGGPSTYVDPRINGFPNDCCKPPDWESFPLPGYVGGGDGNTCLCQSGLHPTPEGRTYGGDLVDLNGDDIPDLLLPDGRMYIVVAPMAAEEWGAIPIGFLGP
jgi:hypothetical protein